MNYSINQNSMFSNKSLYRQSGHSFFKKAQAVLFAFLTTWFMAWFVACSDDNSSAPNIAENESANIRVAIFTSDYQTGELRYMDSLGNVSVEALTLHQDCKLIRASSELYALERYGADNLLRLNPGDLNANSAVIWQVALDDASNPSDIVSLNREEAWLALEGADSLVLISVADGKILKSIKTTKFIFGKSMSPNVVDLEIVDGVLYALMQRYSYNPETASSDYSNGLIVAWDAQTGNYLDTISLLTKNPTAFVQSDSVLWVASQGEYNELYGTDADEERGIEKVNLKTKKSELFVSGEKLGGGVYAFVAHGETAFAAVFKSFGDVPVVEINLKTGNVKPLEGIRDAEGSMAYDGAFLFIGERSFKNEAVYVFDGITLQNNSAENMMAPYSIVIF